MDSGAGGTGDPAGGSGGGKTRRKRCHQRSSPPYRQGRQRPQSILSRVTESFKNIVPRWLQTYFSRDEDVCTCSTDRRQAPQRSENREDDHLTDADEESANIHDGRITPEPPVSNSEDPTTTPASNSPPASTMPSLHGGHLNPCVLESPALICQPSTSSAFPTGSTGVSLVKETKDSTSQPHDGNISTTCGVSSRASAKDIGASKSISVPRLWSVETEPHSVSQNMATSSRERALECSPFKRFSRSIGKSSILQTSQFRNANFYPVKARYGGPGVFIKQPQAQHTPYQVPLTKQMKAKQLTAQSYGVTSLTARRILLQHLEKKSSPQVDAKRIPDVVSPPLNYYPVQRYIIPNPVSTAGNRTGYSQSSVTTSGELKKTNQRIDKNLSSGNETNKTAGHNREQQKSGVCYTNVSVSSANVLPSGRVNGDGKFIHERMGFVAKKPLEEEIGFTLSRPVNKTGSRSVSEPVTNGSDTTASKNTAVPLLWPVETGRYNTLSQHTATSSKKPAFNLSAFGKCSLSIGEPSVLKRNELRDFTSYPGKTTCGGAVAVVRQPKVQNIPYQVPVRRQMKTKQLNTQFCGVDSLRARRILQSLELSTPLSVGSQYPVHSFLTQKPVSIAGSRTAYSQSFLTTSDELKKTNQRVDKKLSFGFTVTRTIEETTELSGFSVILDPVTRASDTSALKNTAVPLLWPTVADGYHTLCQHTATSSEKPAFSVSGFRRLSLSTGKSTILKTRELGDSRFYPGKTRYGGAAAVVRQWKVRKTPYEVPVRRQMKTNQLNRQSCGVMSLTAQRILQCLEMSTPLLVDAQYSSALRPITEKPATIPGNQIVYFKPSLTPLDELRKANQMIDKKLSTVCETAMKPGQYTEQGSISSANVLPSGIDNDSGKTSQERMGFVATKPPKEEIAFTVHQPVGKTTELSGSSVVSVPVTSGSECPPTSASSCPHPLTRPCVHQNHLSFSILESPALHCQQSIPLAFPTDNSGFSKEMKVSASQHDDDHISSTNDTAPSKNTTEPPLWPMEAGRYHTLSQHTDTSSRKPAFNVSVFGRPSLVPVRRQNKAQQLNTQACDETSSKVQQISQCLETLTKPPLESKGFPFIVSSALKSPRYRSGIDTTRNMGAKRQKVDSQYPPVQRLIIPKPVSIAVNPAVYLKQNLTTSGELKKTNQRIKKNLSTGYEKAMKAGQNTTQERMCEVSDSSCGVGNEGDSKTEEKTGLVATKPAEEEVGLAFTVPVTKTTEPSGSKSTSEPIASSSSGSDPELNSSSSNIPTSLSSGGCLGLDKSKKPEGKWDCEVCLVLNIPEATKCVACESAKPGTNSAYKGFDMTSSYSKPAAPSFKTGIASSTAGPLQTFTTTGNIQFRNQEDLQMSMSSDSRYSNPSCESIAFSKGIGNSKPGVSSDSKPEEVQKDNKNDDNFEFGLCSGLSHSAYLDPIQCDIPNAGQHKKKEKGSKLSSVGFSLGMGDVIPRPGKTRAIATTEEKSSFAFGSIQTKAASVAPVTFEMSDAEKEEEMPTPKGLCISGNLDAAPVPLAPFPVLGTTGDQQPVRGTSYSAIFEKKADKEEPKSQPVFSFENCERNNIECSSKQTVSFNSAKPSEKINEEPTEANIEFQGHTNTLDDQVSENPVFSLLNETSFNSSPPAPSATGSMFGSSTPASRAPVAAPVYRQASSGSSSAFGNSARLRICQTSTLSAETISANTSIIGTADNPFVSPSGVLHNNTAWSGISFGATTTPKAADFSFVIDTGPSVPSASPEFHVKQIPTFGQSQVASQQNHLGFGSLSPSTSLFSAGSQPETPTLGRVSRDSQPPVFGQQPVQSSLHCAITPNSSGSISALNSSSSNIPNSLSSAGCLGLDKWKKPEGNRDCEVCLVLNIPEATKCVSCESAKPGPISTLKGLDTTSSYSEPAAPSFKIGIASSTAGPLQTFTATGNTQFGNQEDLQMSMSSDSRYSNPSCESIALSKGIGNRKPGVSSDSKPEEVQKDNKNDDNFEFGLCSGLSHSAYLDPIQCDIPNAGQHKKKEKGSKLSSVGFSLGMGDVIPHPGKTRAIATTEEKSSFAFGSIQTKAASVAPVTFEMSDAEKEEEMPTPKGLCISGNVDPAPVPLAPFPVLGRTGDQQPAHGTSYSAIFEKKADKEEPKSQPVFSFENSEQNKIECSSKQTVSFNTEKPSEKINEEPTEANLEFQGRTNTTDDQVSENPVFSLPNETSFNSSPPAPSATGSMFGSSTPASRAPVAAPVYRQASSGSSSAFSNSARLRICQTSTLSAEIISANTSIIGTADNPFVSPSGVLHNNTAWSGISFGATTTPKAADFSFVIDTGPSVPSASPEFHVKQIPTFGQSQVASQQNHLGFGSLSPSTSLFSAGSQPETPTLGRVSRDSQPPVFGQQPVQSSLHCAITPNSSGSVSALNSSSRELGNSLSSGGSLGLDKLKKPEGNRDCEVCPVVNIPEATECVPCESTKPGTNSAFKGFCTSSLSSKPAAPSVKLCMSSSSSGPSRSLTSTRNVQLGRKGVLKISRLLDSGSANSSGEGIKFSKGTRNHKPSEVHKDNTNDDSFKCGLSSTLSHPTSLAPLQCGKPNVGQQEMKEEGIKPSAVGFSLGMGDVIPSPATTSAIVTTEEKSSFTFGSTQIKAGSVAPVTFEMSDAEKAEVVPTTKGRFISGNVDPAPVPLAPFPAGGRTEDPQPAPVTSSILCDKKPHKEEPKCQPVFFFENSMQSKGDCSSQLAVRFNVAKRSEKESKQATEAIFAFEAQTTTTPDPVSSNPEVSLLNETAFNSSPPAPPATGSTFGSSTPAPRAPVAGAVYRQASSGSSSAVCNSARSRTFPPLARSKIIKPAPTSSTGTAVNPCVSGSGVLRNNTTRTRITFGATTTPRAAGKPDLNSALKGLEPFLRRRQGVSPKSP